MSHGLIMIGLSLAFGSALPIAWDSERMNEVRHLLTGTKFDQRCVKDCTTFSEIDGAIHPINCSLSIEDLPLTQQETCAEVERQAQGTSSKAVHITNDMEWYTFNENSEVKLALNFSWRPGQDSSMASLLNYYVTVTPLDGDSVDLTSFEKCFNIHTQLHERRHKNAEFYYDCYGRDKNADVTPGKSYYVSIQSMPGKATESFKIDIPQNEKPLTGYVEEVFCSNRTFKYSYNVPLAFGDTASVTLCENWPNYFRFCKNVLMEFQGLKPSGTLYNLSIDSSANLTVEYSVFVEGNEAVWRNYSKVDFSVCPSPTLPLPAITKALTSVAIVALLAVAILLLMYCILRDKLSCWKTSKKLPDLMASVAGTEHISDEVPLLRSSVTVYVVFDESDCQHVKVVHAFCRFLMGDLGIKVINHLWEQNKAAQNCTRYMMENFQKAHKVLLVCSKGMRDVLSRNDNWMNMHSQVINQAVTQLAYFDYSSPNDVPKEFPESKKRYKLMTELNELFFALIDEEQVRYGRTLRISKIDDFYDPDKQTKNAEELSMAIERVKQTESIRSED